MTRITSEMIDSALNRIPFKSGDEVVVNHCTCKLLGMKHGTFGECSKGKCGVVAYVYYNGYVLVDFGEPIKGGILNSNSTFKVSQVTPA